MLPSTREDTAMFAPKIAKPQTKAATSPTRKLAAHPSPLVARPFSSSEAVSENMTAREATRGTRDFSKIPLFPPESTSRLQAQSPFRWPRLPITIQPKLIIGDVDAPLEREADRVADQVTRMPDPKFTIAPTPLQISRKCEACEEQELQMLKSEPGGPPRATGKSPSVLHHVLRSPGQQLDAATRAYFEPRFGRDFSRVRVHSDARAAESAEALHALAYTVRQNIVFGTGQYRPELASGKLLLAHELTHVVQQTSPAVKADASSASLDERTSRALRDNIGIGEVSNPQRQTPMVSLTPTTLQRKADDKGPKEAPPKPLKCPDGFELKQRATWLRCDETKGTKHPGCSFCNEGEQESDCGKVLELLGHHNVIAPVEGRCGSKFRITTPQPGAPIIDVVKAEIPGGDTELDINQGVIEDLGLDVKTGRYDVCLKGPIGHDDRLVVTGGSACHKPKEPPKKTKNP
jgi:Domain of unknown function (DUF4157)